jgi:hypothetical protein
MNAEVKRFMEEHQRWLEDILRYGRKNAQFHFEETPTRLARMMFNSLQGKLLVKRSTSDIGVTENGRDPTWEDFHSFQPYQYPTSRPGRG